MPQERRLTIITRYVPPPIPSRKWDWIATANNYELPEHPVGVGFTEGEAVMDLYEQIAEREADAEEAQAS